jgi:cellulose synthase operon protein C
MGALTASVMTASPTEVGPRIPGFCAVGHRGSLRGRLAGMTMLGGLMMSMPLAARSQDVPSGAVPAQPDAGTVHPASVAENRLIRAQALMDLVLEEGHYWIDAGQFARARGSIQRALAIEPANTDALGMLCTAQIGDGDLAGAAQTLDRLVAAGGSTGQVARLRAALHAGPVDAAGLDEARRLAASGNMLGAMFRYRALFRNGDPPPGLALEYYRVLGGTILGYNEARSKLAALVDGSPHDLDARLALAQIQTYRDVSRPAGLAELRRLALGAGPPAIRQQAAGAWRDTLAWLPIVGASISFYMDWLALHPDDSVIVTRLEKARATQATIDEGNDRTEGFVLLGNGRLDAADAAFQRALVVNPRDADVLGGLGLVAQRRRQVALARGLFHRAIAADAARAPHWRAALVALDAVGGNDPEIVSINRLMANGQYDAARAALAHLARRPDMDFTALLMTGGLDRMQGRTAEAEQVYRLALRHRPDDPDATFNLADLLFQSGQEPEARRLMARLAIRRPALLPRLQAADEAARAALAGTDVQRIALLRQALAQLPGDPWLTLRLAQALYHDDQEQGARALMAGLTADARAPVANLQAGVIFAMTAHDFDRAAVLLERVPGAARGAGMQRDAQLVALYQQVRAIPADDPRSVLILADQPDPTGDRAAILVDALAARHDDGSARWVLAHEDRITATSLPAQKLAYAGLAIRLRAPDDAQRELDAYDRLVPGRATPPPADEVQMREDLDVGLAILRTDLELQARQPKQAYRIIAPAVTQHARSAPAWLALGRVYRGLDQPQQALRADQEALLLRPDWVDAIAAVAQDALTLDDRPAARAMERRLAARAPNTPQTWQVRAGNDRADGRDRQQLADLEQARTLQCRTDSSAGCTPVDQHQPDYRWPDIDSEYVPLQGAALPATSHYLPQDGQVASMNRQIVYLHDSTAAQLDANTYVRSRLGTAGLGQLTELATPITGTIPFGSWQNRVSFSVTPTFLFTGDPLRQSYTARQFGTVAVNGAPSWAYHPYDTQGVGLDLRYVDHWFAADVGSTPLGFPIANVLGGVEFAPRLTDHLTLRISGGRRMVTDSELSYAGMRDPGTGRTWGGVTRVNGHGALEWAQSSWNVYAGGGFAYLSGTHVEDNTEIEGGLGGSATVWQSQQRQRLRVGVNLTYYGYRRNSYEFTWGQGGYFSPQSYYAIMPSAEYSGHIDRWTWFVRGEGGFQDYRAASAPYFPLDSGLQQTLAAIGSSRFGKQSDSGIAGTGRARLVYQVSNGLRLGVEGGYTRSGSWSEASGMLMAHYTFDTP